MRPVLVATIHRPPHRVIESIRPISGTISPRTTVRVPFGPCNIAVAPSACRIIQPGIVVGLVSGTGAARAALFSENNLDADDVFCGRRSVFCFGRSTDRLACATSALALPGCVKEPVLAVERAFPQLFDVVFELGSVGKLAANDLLPMEGSAISVVLDVGTLRLWAGQSKTDAMIHAEATASANTSDFETASVALSVLERQ
jgi:hypothetical protein